MARVLVLLFMLALAACGSDYGGGGSGKSSCVAIYGGSTTILVEDEGCPGCVATDEEQAIDNNLQTAGNLISASPVSTFTGMRATAQSGVVYPAGSKAGVVANISRNANVQNGSMTVRTYLQGALQEQASDGLTVAGVNGVSNGSVNLYQFTTTEPFDAVAFGLFGSSNNLDIDYYEFCHNVTG